MQGGRPEQTQQQNSAKNGDRDRRVVFGSHQFLQHPLADGSQFRHNFIPGNCRAARRPCLRAGIPLQCTRGFAKPGRSSTVIGPTPSRTLNHGLRTLSEDARICEQRLHNQCLTGRRAGQAADIVSWLGAVQAQEFAAARWALALRMAKGPQDAEIQHAFNQGLILRTHVMRPTWHFVAPADIHWMRELTALRVRQAMTSHDRKFGLTGAIHTRANAVFERAFRHNEFLTRAELGAELKRAGLDEQGVRLALLTVHAEVDGILCSGPQRGRELTYALLGARVPLVRRLERDEALAELTRRYFQSRGPATIRDFVWWSGLRISDAKRGLEMNNARSNIAGDFTDWTIGDRTAASHGCKIVHLLPVFDEYFIAYRDRDSVTKMGRRGVSGPVTSRNALMVGGRMVGIWKTLPRAEELRIEVTTRRLTDLERHGLTEAAARYGRFLGVSVSLAIG